MLLLVCSAAMAADLPRKAPELAISLTDGQQVRLSAYKGKVVAMCFILTGCPHCQKTIGYLVKDQAEYGPRGFQVLASAINEDAPAAVPGFIKSFNTPVPGGLQQPADGGGLHAASAHAGSAHAAAGVYRQAGKHPRPA